MALGDPEVLVKTLDDLGVEVRVLPMIFTNRVTIGAVDDAYGYDDGWCYNSHEAALAAAEAWDPRTQKEPEGWHRHPRSGRRRVDGDPATEYVSP